MHILVLNAGSSTQKSCLYALDGESLPSQPPEPLWEAAIDWSYQDGAALITVKTHHGASLKHQQASESRAADTQTLLNTLWQGETAVLESLAAIDGVGHRIVHGGEEYQSSTRVDEAVKEAIARLCAIAPIHNPAGLAGIEAIEQALGPEIPQVAVFDTAFHAQMPLEAALYPVPYAWSEQGIRRYGFHGISHQYCAQRAADLLERDLADLNLITCHLGSGCSLAAVQGGRSINTTMGLTPLEGLMMGTRSGTVDPGLLLHRLRQGDDTVESLDRALNKESGLLGISGVSSDLRQVTRAAEDGNERAQLAIAMYIHRLQVGIGAMLASLGGLDALVFTAGVGENSDLIRAKACEAFGFLGLQLDPAKNAARPVDADIAAAGSSVRVLVIHTQEDWAIAQECWNLLH